LPDLVEIECIVAGNPAPLTRRQDKATSAVFRGVSPLYTSGGRRWAFRVGRGAERSGLEPPFLSDLIPRLTCRLWNTRR
jgi:hypothetical protein